MNILFILENLIYFLNLSAIIVNIFQCTTSKSKYVISLSVNTLVLLISLVISESMLFFICLIFPFIQIFSLRLTFANSKLTSIIYAYLYIYAANTILVGLISILISAKHSDTLWLEFIINICVSAFCFILCISNIKNKLCQLRDGIPLAGKRLLLIFLILSMLLLLLTFENNFYTNAKRWFSFIQKLSIIIILFLFVVIIFLIYIMLSNTQLKQITANYEHQINVQANHYRELAQTTYDIRRFKHDFKNMSIAIEQLLADGNNSEALQLFRKCNGTLEGTHTSTILFDTGNGIADALLTDKQQKARACNTNIMFSGAIPDKYLAPTDICVILGNTLDNALEACEKLPPEENKTISVSCKCNSGFLFLSIENPISKTIKIKNNQIVTTKKNKTLHGFGLYSLSSVIKNYDGNMELKSINNTFSVQIDLCLINKTYA